MTLAAVSPAVADQKRADDVSLNFYRLPSSSLALDRCVGVGEPDVVVRMSIPKGLNAADGDRFVRFIRRAAPPTTTDDDEEVFQDSEPNKGVVKVFRENPFHLNLHSIFPPGAPAEWVKIRVILRDKAYKFFAGPGSNGILGVSIDREDKGPGKVSEWLCQKRDEAFSRTRKRNKNVLTYFARYEPNGGIAPLNIHIVADEDPQSGASGGWQTPIIIDPRIKNDGAP